MKSKLTYFLIICILSVFAYQLGAYFHNLSEIRQLTKEKLRLEIQLLKTEIELNDLEIQKEN